MELKWGPWWWSGGGGGYSSRTQDWGPGVDKHSQAGGGYGGGASPALAFSLQEPGSRCHHHPSCGRARPWS